LLVEVEVVVVKHLPKQAMALVAAVQVGLELEQV
jgi:hypothetical protein